MSLTCSQTQSSLVTVTSFKGEEPGSSPNGRMIFAPRIGKPSAMPFCFNKLSFLLWGLILVTENPRKKPTSRGRSARLPPSQLSWESVRLKFQRSPVSSQVKALLFCHWVCVQFLVLVGWQAYITALLLAVLFSSASQSTRLSPTQPELDFLVGICFFGPLHKKHTPWQHGRVVKAIDQKSIGRCPREFESLCCRFFLAQSGAIQVKSEMIRGMTSS